MKDKALFTKEMDAIIMKHMVDEGKLGTKFDWVLIAYPREGGIASIAASEAGKHNTIAALEQSLYRLSDEDSIVRRH